MMQEIMNDAFYDLLKEYGFDSEDHYAGEVYYYLLTDDQPYQGLPSHREALRIVFDGLEKRRIENRERAKELWGERCADTDPWVCDLAKAQAVLLDAGAFFDCPNIIKIDYYGNVTYDAEWIPNDENFGTTVPYWYAVLEPVQGRRNRPEDFKKVNEALFPKGRDELDIYEWTTDWADYFEAGHEWYGSCCWTVYDRAMNRYIVMLVSATD